MKIRFGVPTMLTAAVLVLAGTAPIAEGCEGAKGVPTRSQFRSTMKKRIPLSTFMAGVKTTRTAATSDAAPATTEPPVTGLWSTGFVDGDQVVDAGFEMFSMGGTHTLNDPSPILEGNVCLGAWTQVAPLTYLINHPSYLYDDQGDQVIGLVTIYEKVVLDPGGDSFQEDVRVVITDMDGVVQQTIDGQAVGKRVKGEDNPLK